MQFDVTFPAVRCSILSLDTMDISGEQHYDIVRTTQLFSIKFSVPVILMQIHDFCLVALFLFLSVLMSHVHTILIN